MKAMMQNPMIAAMIPGAEAMKAQNMQIGHKRMGYDWMMEINEPDWINAFFGSKEEAEAIPSLEEGYKLFHPSEEEQKLDHGYEKKGSAAGGRSERRHRGGKGLGFRGYISALPLPALFFAGESLIAKNYDIAELGLFAEAAKNLYTGCVNAEIVKSATGNRPLFVHYFSERYFATAPFYKENFITVRRNARPRSKNSENWTLLIEKTGFLCGKG